MKIKIEDGRASVEFRTSEAKAMRQVVEICTDLAEWLDDEQCSLVAEALRQVVARYANSSVEEEKAEVVG